MSVATLYDAFVRAAAQGRLDAAILPLMGKLVAVLGVDVLPVTGGRAERLPSTARLTGTSSWADGTGWTLILTGTVDDAGRDQLALSLEARTTDGFVYLTTLIPDLPSSRVPVPRVRLRMA